jgi:signal peptidase II
VTAVAVPHRAMSRLALCAYALGALTLALDQMSKTWVLQGLHLAERGSVPLLPVLSLTLTWNRGFSFGLLSGVDMARWGLFAFSLAVAAALALWVRRARRWPSGLAIGLIMGGAVGNAVDRVRYGAVVDFIDVTRIGFFPWIFNLADSAITIGVILLLLDGLVARSPAEE